MDREDALDAFTLDQPANRHGLAHAGVLAGDHVAFKNLHAFLRAVEDLLVDLDAIANAEVGHVGFTLRLFDDLERGGFHGWFLFSPAVPFGPRLNFCSCRHFAMAW